MKNTKRMVTSIVAGVHCADKAFRIISFGDWFLRMLVKSDKVMGEMDDSEKL